MVSVKAKGSEFSSISCLEGKDSRLVGRGVTDSFLQDKDVVDGDFAI